MPKKCKCVEMILARDLLGNPSNIRGVFFAEEDIGVVQ